MSTFKAQCLAHREVIIDGGSGEPGWIRLAIKDRGVHAYGALLDPADAPAIALAVMEAGAAPIGALYDYDSAAHAYYEAMNWLTTARDRAEKETAAAAEEAARGKRRDELAVEYFEGAYYHLERIGYRRAVDSIMILQDELAKERAK